MLERLTTLLLTLTLKAASSLVAVRTVRELSRTPSYRLLCLRFWRQDLHWLSDLQCPRLGLWVQRYQHVPPSGSTATLAIVQPNGTITVGESQWGNMESWRVR